MTQGTIKKLLKIRYIVIVITAKKGMVLTLLHTKCILMTKYQFSHQCLHGWGNPTTQELEKEPNNAQMPIPTQAMKSPSA